MYNCRNFVEVTVYYFTNETSHMTSKQPAKFVSAPALPAAKLPGGKKKKKKDQTLRKQAGFCLCISYNCRVTEYPEMDWTHKGHPVKLLASHRTAENPTR